MAFEWIKGMFAKRYNDQQTITDDALGPNSPIGKEVAKQAIEELLDYDFDGINGLSEELKESIIEAAAETERLGKPLMYLEDKLHDLLETVDGLSIEYYGGYVYYGQDEDNRNDFIFNLAQKVLVHRRKNNYYSDKKVSDNKLSDIIGEQIGVMIIPGRDKECPICLQFCDAYLDPSLAPQPPFHPGCACGILPYLPSWEKSPSLVELREKKLKITKEMIDSYVIHPRRDNFKRRLKKSEKEMLLAFIKNHDGIFQSNLYKEFPNLRKTLIRDFFFEESNKGTIERIKKRGTYQLYYKGP